MSSRLVVGGAALALATLLILAAMRMHPAGIIAGSPADLPQDTASVMLTDAGFTPHEITIRVGGTVTFSTTRALPFWPASDSHPSHSIYPEFDPHGPIAANEHWTFRFDKVGDWGYHDHLRSYFTGTIHVVS